MQQADIGLGDGLELSLATARQELVYDNAVSQTKVLIGDEQSRALRTRVLLAEADQEVLRNHLGHMKSQLQHAERITADIREQLERSQEDLNRTEKERQAGLREIVTLKAQINSLQNTSADTSKLLAEKAALTRDISTLEQEIESLRSLDTSYQAAVSEKLALERQLSSLELELDSEKRALQKARLNNPKKYEKEMASQLDELRKELANAKREREKVEKDANNEAKEWARERALFEAQINAAKIKLKDGETSVQDAQGNDERPSSSSFDVVRGEKDTAKARKRDLSAFKSDLIIATPGAVKIPTKAKRLSTAPGHKSTFSITPFINRVSTNTLSSGSSSDGVDERRRPQRREDKRKGVGHEDIDSNPLVSPVKRAPRIDNEANFTAKAARKVEGESDPMGTLVAKTKPSAPTTQKATGKRQRFLGKRRGITLFDDG